MYTIFSVKKIKYCNNIITSRLDFLFYISYFIENDKYFIQCTFFTPSWSNIITKDDGRFSKYAGQSFLGICFCQLWMICNSSTLMPSKIYKIIDYHNVVINPISYYIYININNYKSRVSYNYQFCLLSIAMPQLLLQIHSGTQDKHMQASMRLFLQVMRPPLGLL